VIQCVTDGVSAGERRQQARVGVEDPTSVRGEGPRSDDPHVAGQDHDVRTGAVERIGEGVVRAARNQGRIDPLLACPVEGRARPVRDDEDDLAPDLAARGGGVKRAQVRAASRNGDGDPACLPPAAPRETSA
jgi:hypothetical protein